MDKISKYFSIHKALLSIDSAGPGFRINRDKTLCFELVISTIVGGASAVAYSRSFGTGDDTLRDLLVRKAEITQGEPMFDLRDFHANLNALRIGDLVTVGVRSGSIKEINSVMETAFVDFGKAAKVGTGTVEWFPLAKMNKINPAKCPNPRLLGSRIRLTPTEKWGFYSRSPVQTQSWTFAQKAEVNAQEMAAAEAVCFDKEQVLVDIQKVLDKEAQQQRCLRISPSERIGDLRQALARYMLPVV